MFLQVRVPAVIGKIRNDGLYVVNYHGKEFVRANAYDVTKGIVYDRPYMSAKKKLSEPNLAAPTILMLYYYIVSA